MRRGVWRTIQAVSHRRAPGALRFANKFIVIAAKTIKRFKQKTRSLKGEMRVSSTLLNCIKQKDGAEAAL
jgi:hypothetical protein